MHWRVPQKKLPTLKELYWRVSQREGAGKKFNEIECREVESIHDKVSKHMHSSTLINDFGSKRNFTLGQTGSFN
jgi:hypothetical protein